MSRTGRAGPPLWLGLMVVILGPAICLSAAFFGLANRLDLNSVHVTVNKSSTVLRSNTSYIVAASASASDSGSQPCRVVGSDGEDRTFTPPEAGSADQIYYAGHQFVTRGFTHIDTANTYRITCPAAGKRLLLVPIQGNLATLGVTSSLMMQGAGASALIGLLMMVFRRKFPT